MIMMMMHIINQRTDFWLKDLNFEAERMRCNVVGEWDGERIIYIWLARNQNQMQINCNYKSNEFYSWSSRYVEVEPKALLLISNWDCLFNSRTLKLLEV